MKTEIAHFKQYLERRYPDRSTAKHYLNDLSIFSDFVGDRSPREISVKTIDAFVQAQSSQNLKPATINRRLIALDRFFHWAKRTKQVQDNPFEVLETVLVKEQKNTAPRWLNRREQLALLRAERKAGSRRDLRRSGVD